MIGSEIVLMDLRLQAVATNLGWRPIFWDIRPVDERLNPIEGMYIMSGKQFQPTPDSTAARQQLDILVAQIGPPDEAAAEAARKQQAQLTKPPGSLGRLEEFSIRLAAIFGRLDFELSQKVILTAAADHGVVAEGVSAYPQAVTGQMVLNFLYGGAAINVLARHVDARVVIADLGVATELPDHPNLINKKIGYGSANLSRGPAMSEHNALKALLAGADIIAAELDAGLDILGTGDMGIGNTTPSAALAAAFTGIAPAEIAGRGTGVDDDGLARKVDAIERGLAVNRPDPDDALDVLAKVGGFEIAGLAGAILGAAAAARPVVIDGFISTAAAMVAVGFAPAVRPYLFAAHRSQERGHGIMWDSLELSPFLDLDLRLGEGTGAAMAISLLEAAGKILNEMATFAEAGVADRDE
jgi:nicotinate-nucleotide--dimethylbenzimidazole phosphoribosyltransferase